MLMRAATNLSGTAASGLLREYAHPPCTHEADGAVSHSRTSDNASFV